ncbi:hypothetical protein [Chroococcidiopsis sp.]|uniref:hypothetical protein n=1 Tax=Chroococcidiopsis sp. TaxID=3088168 RepID=UPI003F2C4588
MQQVFIAIVNFIINALIVFIVFSPIIWLVARSVSTSNHRAKTEQEYEATKEALRQDPGSIRLREAALNAGRRYYGSLRDGGLPSGSSFNWQQSTDRP